MSTDFPQTFRRTITPKIDRAEDELGISILEVVPPNPVQLAHCSEHPGGYPGQAEENIQGNCGTIFTPRTIGTFWESYRLNFQ